VSPKILHVSTYAGSGGAGRAAASLHQAMLTHGLNSSLLTSAGTSFRLARAFDRELWRLQRSPNVTWRSPARFGSLHARDINSLDIDVVNLHWVTDGFLSVEEIGKITKPIVWTMHDMWPFTGTEHYTEQPSSSQPQAEGPSDAPVIPRWVTGYTGANRPSEESGLDLDRWTWKRKKSNWVRSPHLVPCSTWLRDLAAQSALAGHWQATVIPNVMPVHLFAPQDKQLARRELGLPEGKPLILFTASAGIHDTRKGWQHLRDALPRVQQSFADVGVIVVGPHSPKDDAGSSANIHWQGEVHSDDCMARIIAAADVVAVPSVMDNLPMTACEAQACGRPVAAFNIGGLPDIVSHQRTGFLAEAFDSADYAEGLIQSIRDSLGDQRWSREARDKAMASWSPSTVVLSYLDLYEQVTQ